MSKWHIAGKEKCQNGLFNVNDKNGEWILGTDTVQHAEQIIREHNANEELVCILENILQHDTFNLRNQERKTIESALQKAKGNE